ncbi:hypothetical protein Scep_010483 [Stephania cephalantha]|uniref:ABC transmembrane type-1 domain-containing protein n=1 Tax=Stephania cephalantha TaxID=152367 RepID=A0AAP0JV77_9MAGN
MSHTFDALDLCIGKLEIFLFVYRKVVIAFSANWILAFVILVLLSLVGLNGYIQLKFMKGFSADAKMMYEEASQVANDAVGSIRTVASFCAEEKVIQLYKQKCEGPIKTSIR